MIDDRSKMRDGDMPLLDRIESAMRRVTNGEGQMRVPVEATDPDVVLYDCKREIERLMGWEGAAREWLDKTEWVQEQIDSGHLSAKYLGKHRADIMRAEVDRLRGANQGLQGWLYRSGFVPCDIAACNCGGWHARYGLPERMEELKTLLSDAGHPLTNENGNLPLQALADLIGERDTLRGDLAEASKDAARWRTFCERSDLSGDILAALEIWGGPTDSGEPDPRFKTVVQIIDDAMRKEVGE